MADMLDFIQQVKRNTDIVDVIAGYLELRQRGANFVARCPFHGEKTASFTVSRNLQIFKCFGCGESGDVIKFVQKYESCTYMEAVEMLAKRANMKMPEIYSQRQDKDYAERKRQKDEHLAICKDAATFYYKTYYSPQGEIARNYMQSRGFDVATCKKFGVGYSPDRHGLVNHLKAKGYNLDACVKCGVLQRYANGGYFDALSNRLIIPIFNIQGKVIAFGGRALTERENAFGKYKNTSDTPLFTKKNNLFALHIAKEAKQQAALPNLVVVEGYMDVIAMYQAGFRRAVASMGTSLTEQQAKWIGRLCDTVYICYDGDSAGQKATVRGLDILDKAGLKVLVMSVPEKLDPDEYIKKYGTEAFEKLIDDALPLPDYKLKLLGEAFPINSADMAKRNDALQNYVRGALVMLRQLDDVRQQQYIAAVSLTTGYSQDFFRRKLVEPPEQKGNYGNADEAPPPEQTQQISQYDRAKYFIAASMLNNQPYALLEQKPTCNSAFLSALFDYVFECKARGEQPRPDMLYTVCPNATEQQYALIVDVDFSAKRQDKNEQYFHECKQLVQMEELRTKRDKLLAQIKQHPEDASLLTQLAEISQKINTVQQS